jgi:hypothetical protein
MPDFPPKYKGGIVKSAGLCSVKRNIIAPLQFAVSAGIRDE